jgi:uncharacterized protein (DUF433 family)
MRENWKKYIHSDPAVLVGKPLVKGTRLSVEFLLKLMAQGWNKEQIIKNYPSLNSNSLQAAFAFAAECLPRKILS